MNKLPTYFKLSCYLLLISLLTGCASYIKRTTKYDYLDPFYQSLRNPDTLLLCYNPFLCPVFVVDYSISAAIDTVLLPIDFGLYLYGINYSHMTEQETVGAFTLNTFRDINNNQTSQVYYNKKPLPQSLQEGTLKSCFAKNAMLNKNVEVVANKTLETLFIFNSDIFQCSFLLQEKQGKLIAQEMPKKYLLHLDYNTWTYNASTQPNTLWLIDVLYQHPRTYRTWDISKIPPPRTTHQFPYATAGIKDYYWTTVLSVSPDKLQAVYMTNDRSALWILDNATHTQKMITLSSTQQEHLKEIETAISKTPPSEEKYFKSIFYAYTAWFNKTYNWQEADNHWQLAVRTQAET